MTAPAPEQTPREALEAVFWRHWPLHRNDFRTRSETAGAAVLNAADAYAADEVKAALEIARRVPLTTAFGHRYTVIPDSGEVELHCGSHAPEAVTWRAGYHPSLDVLIGQAMAHDAAEHGNVPPDPPEAEIARLRARAAGLGDLVRDVLEAFPDTADEQEWRDRAGRLDVRDANGQPYRAHTEEEL